MVGKGLTYGHCENTLFRVQYVCLLESFLNQRMMHNMQNMTYGMTYDRLIYIYIYIYYKFTANSSMWSSLRLAPIMYCKMKLL